MDSHDEVCDNCSERPCQCEFRDARAPGLRLLEPLPDDRAEGGDSSPRTKLVREYKGPKSEDLRRSAGAREALPPVDDESACGREGDFGTGRLVLGPGARAALAEETETDEMGLLGAARELQRRAVALARAVFRLQRGAGPSA